MPAYRLLQHKNFEQSLTDLSPAARRKAVWAQVLLGTNGRTPVVKGTMGRNARWRRSPVQGNHYYLWWIPQSESDVANGSNGLNTILVHSVRHHDLTDQPVNAGDLADYVLIPVDTLDPRYDEQRAISRLPEPGNVRVATIKGLPGSGKTVALLYLLRDLLAGDDDGRILYVTYTARLKRAAQEFVESQYTARTGRSPEALRTRLRIVTLNELVSELTGMAIYLEPFAELKEFHAFLQRQNPADLGPWRAYPRTLFTEIRANLLGRDFPPDYDWAQENLGGGIDPQAYARERDLTAEEGEVACQLAQRVRHMRFFRDQAAARQALSQVIAGQTPPWLDTLDALVVDEVQDLTLVQIALMAELLRTRARRAVGRGLTLTVAGDESQIVQPSGFDWGLTKYMLGEQIGIWPEEFEFQYQRRAPDNLAQIIDNSWQFYGHLPKRFRPSAKRARMLTERSGGAPDLGQIFLSAPPSPDLNAAELLALDDAREDRLDVGEAGDRPLHQLLDGLADEQIPWAALMAELASRPGRALVDLTEGLAPWLDPQVQSLADEVVYLPREIKGLERHTILIHGLNDLYLQARDLCVDAGQDAIPRYEARRLFDEMRVALSRSTHRLILLEAEDAPVLRELSIDELDGVSAVGWTDLLLAMQTEEMSEIEAIEGYLSEVEDLLERDRWRQAEARNRRAYRLAVRIGDHALQREAERQHVAIALQQAERLLAGESWQAAYAANRQARARAAQADDPAIWRRVDDQLARIQTVAGEQADRLLDRARSKLAEQAPAAAYAAAKQAQELVAILPPGLALEPIDDAVADAAWAWSVQLVAGADEAVPERAAELLDESAAMMNEQGNAAGAAGLAILRDRYRAIPARRRLSEEDVGQILDFAVRYLDQLAPLRPEPDAYVHLAYWLRDTYARLEEHFPLYYRWASVAQRLGALTGNDEYRTSILHLEERLDAIFDRAGAMSRLWDGDLDLQRFRILLSGLHGDHADASAAWEALGDLAQAADQARLAGELERAYQLQRTAKLPIDEDLATAVKFLRLLEQVEQKHADLRANERAALLARMAELSDQLRD